MLPLAHVGHYAIWVLYAVPVLVVAAAIVRSMLLARRYPPGETPSSVDELNRKDV